MNPTRIPNTASKAEVRQAFQRLTKSTDILLNGDAGSVLIGAGNGVTPVWSTTLELTLLTVDDITINGASIVSGTGAISFGDDDISTTGSISGVNVTSGIDPGHTHTADSITESDPIFTSSPAYEITDDDITAWDTVYGWGNHADAGYLTEEVDDLDSVTSRGASTDNTVTVGSLIDSELSSGRIVYSGVGGLLSVSGNLIYDGTVLRNAGGSVVVSNEVVTTSLFAFYSRRHVEDTGSVSFRCLDSVRISSSGTTPIYQIGSQGSVSQQIEFGKTNSGYSMYFNGTILRNFSYSSSLYPGLKQDGGTLSKMWVVFAQIGHLGSTPTESPITSYVYGIDITPTCRSGVISNFRAISLSATDGVSVPTTWVPSSAYSKNTKCKPSVDNGYYYVCTTAGTSGVSEPSWNTPQYSETNDNDVVWTAILIPAITNFYGLYLQNSSAKHYITGNIGIRTTSPTAYFHIAAGTTAANTAPLKFTSGSLNSTAEVGAVEFLSDKLYFTITTGAARKEIALSEGLTSGKIPIATTNGRLMDGQAPLSGTKIYYVADSDSGAVSRKLTFINGILTAET